MRRALQGDPKHRAGAGLYLKCAWPLMLLPSALRLQLVAAIVFISFGVVTAFCCAVVDGVFAAQHMVSLSF